MNVLAEKILLNNSSGQGDHHVQEVFTIFPSFQYGMDVNPKFTSGPTGVEYTIHLNAFDLLRIELVHGWLVEPDAEEYELIKNRTYNQLVNLVIEGKDAATTLQKDDHPTEPSDTTTSSQRHDDDDDELSTKAIQAAMVQNFLDRSGHQLTQYGLDVLYEHLKDGQMVVFFRNNHFNTLTKHAGMLYLLVTDFGYAQVSNVVWEKLDVIDGDTEYVNAEFSTSPAAVFQDGGPNMNDDPRSHSDYHLALQLSQENYHQAKRGNQPIRPGPHGGELERARRASIEEYNRNNPHDPIQIDRNLPEGTTVLGKSVASWTDRMKEAGTNFSMSLQDVAAQAKVVFQPVGYQAPSNRSEGIPNQAAESSIPSQLRRSNPQAGPSLSVDVQQQPTVAVMGSPAKVSSQEDHDRMLAMSLPQQEDEQIEQIRQRSQTPSRPQAILSPRSPRTGRRPAGDQKDNCIVS